MPQARAGRASHTQDIGAPVDGHGHAAHMNNEAINHLATLGDRTAGAGAVLVVALIGVLISWHYKREANRRHIAEHALRMERLRRGQRGDTDLSELGADE